MPVGLLQQAQLTWANFLLDVWQSGQWEAQPAEDRLYGQRHLIEHLDLAQMPGDTLYDFLRKEWHNAWLVVDATYTGYLNDIGRIWRRADAEENLAMQVKCALCRSTVVTFSTSIPEGLLSWAVQGGQLTADQALDVVQRIPDESLRANELSYLIPDLPQNGLPLALEVVRSITYSYSISRAELLESLISRLPDALLPEALKVIRETEAPSDRAQAMTAVIPRLPADRALALAAETLEVVREIHFQRGRARELVRLAPHMSPELLVEALEIARALEGDESRVRALTGLIPHLPDDWRPSALRDTLDMARQIEPEEVHAIKPPVLRARALAALVPYLDDQTRAEIGREVLDLFDSITDLIRGADILGALGPYLPEDLLDRAFAIALDFADWARMYSLGQLAPVLSQEQLAVALNSARSIKDRFDRRKAVQALAPYLSERQLDGLDPSLLVAADLADEEPLEAEQSKDRLASLLDEARQIKRASDRVEALSDLLPELDRSLQTVVVAEALDAARIIEDDQDKQDLVDELDSARPVDEVTADAHAWYGLFIDYLEDGSCRVEVHQDDFFAYHSQVDLVAEPLGEEALAQLLAEARAAHEEERKWDILTEIAPSLSAATEMEALAILRSIDSDYFRVRALVDLAPFLSEPSLTQALRLETLIDSQRGTTSEFGVLLPVLTDEIVLETWELLKTVGREDSLRIGLDMLLPRLPPDRLDEALELGLSIGDFDERAEAMIALAPYVSDGNLEMVLGEALDALTLAVNEDDYPEPFLRVLAYLPDHMLDRGLEVAGNLFVEDEKWRRTWAFRGFADRLARWSRQDPDAAYAGWRAALARAADNPRPQMLRDLTGLHYFALALAGDADATVRGGIRQAVEEVCSW